MNQIGWSETEMQTISNIFKDYILEKMNGTPRHAVAAKGQKSFKSFVSREISSNTLMHKTADTTAFISSQILAADDPPRHVFLYKTMKRGKRKHAEKSQSNSAITSFTGIMTNRNDQSDQSIYAQQISQLQQ